jgi:hypothetical protein
MSASRRLAAAAAVMLGLASAACAPSLSTFQPAHVAPRGHVQVSMGLEAAVSVGALADAIDAGKSLASKAAAGQTLTDDEKWRLFDAGINLVLNAPSVGPHFGLAYTLLPRFEMNLRYAGTALRVGSRYQLLARASGAPVDVVVGLGVAHYSFEFPIPQIDIIKIEDFSRWQLDIPLLVGTSRDWYRVWAGPKLVFTWFDTRMALALPSERPVAMLDGSAYYVGGQAGFALGYRSLFVAFELTMASASGSASVTSIGLNPPTRNTALSTFLVYPSFGLMGEL